MINVNLSSEKAAHIFSHRGKADDAHTPNIMDDLKEALKKSETVQEKCACTIRDAVFAVSQAVVVQEKPAVTT